MNNSTQVCVSVAISTHNRVDYLRQAVESVLNQSFADFEIIICDDGSTDNTPTICQELEQIDSRVHTLRHPVNLGMVGNWQSGLAASSAQFFTKLDDDNLYLPSFLEKTVAALQAEPSITYAFTDEWFVDNNRNYDIQTTQEASERYGRSELTPGLHKDSCAIALSQSPGLNSTVFDRQRLVDAGGFRTLGGELADFDVFLNLAQQKHACYYVPERLLEYRIHSGANTATLSDRIDQANRSIAILQSILFDGEAEQHRRRKLAGNYIWLSRTLAMQGDFSGARQAITQARRLAPNDLKTILISSALSLPTGLLKSAMRTRYGNRFHIAH